MKNPHVPRFAQENERFLWAPAAALKVLHPNQVAVEDVATPRRLGTFSTVSELENSQLIYGCLMGF